MEKHWLLLLAWSVPTGSGCAFLIGAQQLGWVGAYCGVFVGAALGVLWAVLWNECGKQLVRRQIMPTDYLAGVLCFGGLVGAACGVLDGLLRGAPLLVSVPIGMVGGMILLFAGAYGGPTPD